MTKKVLSNQNIKTMTAAKLHPKYHHMEMMTINPILADKFLIMIQTMVTLKEVNDKFEKCKKR